MPLLPLARARERSRQLNQLYKDQLQLTKHCKCASVYSTVGFTHTLTHSHTYTHTHTRRHLHWLSLTHRHPHDSHSSLRCVHVKSCKVTSSPYQLDIWQLEQLSLRHLHSKQYFLPISTVTLALDLLLRFAQCQLVPSRIPYAGENTSASRVVSQLTICYHLSSRHLLHCDPSAFKLAPIYTLTTPSVSFHQASCIGASEEWICNLQFALIDPHPVIHLTLILTTTDLNQFKLLWTHLWVWLFIWCDFSREKNNLWLMKCHSDGLILAGHSFTCHCWCKKSSSGVKLLLVTHQTCHPKCNSVTCETTSEGEKQNHQPEKSCVFLFRHFCHKISSAAFQFTM